MKQAEKIYMISDTAKKVKVESHVLRYWEDELKLPIKRNEMGHRYYTEEDIQRFCDIKELKEQGLQLRAIRNILKTGAASNPLVMLRTKEAENNLSAAHEDSNQKIRSEMERPEKERIVNESTENERFENERCETVKRESEVSKNKEKEYIRTESERREGCKREYEKMSSGKHETGIMKDTIILPEENMKRQVVMVNKGEFVPIREESREAKSMRLQQLLQNMIMDAVRVNNQELCDEIKENMLKELDYQFRLQEEREEEREEVRLGRQETHYRELDELLRSHSKKGRKVSAKQNEVHKELKKDEKLPEEANAETDIKSKRKGFLRKKHSIL